MLYGFTFHLKKIYIYQKLEPENIWNFILVHGQILQHQWFKPGIEYELNEASNISAFLVRANNTDTGRRGNSMAWDVWRALLVH